MNNKHIIWAIGTAMLAVGYMTGFLICAIVLAKREANTIEYQHYVLEQNGYHYCPYCGEELKIEMQDKVIL